MTKKKHEAYGPENSTEKKGDEIVVVDHTKYGVSSQIAQNIKDQFSPMLDKMVELESEYNIVVAGNPMDDQVVEDASELLKKYVKVRTGVDKIHKEQKAFYLAGGRFIDGWKNAHLMASTGKEFNLKAIKEYRENLEKKRLDKLQEERELEIQDYLEEEESHIDYRKLEAPIWSAYVSGKKKSFKDLQTARAVALEKEKAEAEIEKLRSARLAITYRYEDFIIEFVEDWGLISQEDFDRIISTAKQNKEEYAAKAAADAKAASEAKETVRKLKEAAEASELARIASEAQAEKLRKAVISQGWVGSRPENHQTEAEPQVDPAASLSGTERDTLRAWVFEMDLPVCPNYGHAVSLEIINKFQGFKAWADRLIVERVK